MSITNILLMVTKFITMTYILLYVKDFVKRIVLAISVHCYAKMSIFVGPWFRVVSYIFSFTALCLFNTNMNLELSMICGVSVCLFCVAPLRNTWHESGFYLIWTDWQHKNFDRFNGCSNADNILFHPILFSLFITCQNLWSRLTDITNNWYILH